MWRLVGAAAFRRFVQPARAAAATLSLGGTALWLNASSSSSASLHCDAAIAASPTAAAAAHSARQVAGAIDHTLLKPDACPVDVVQLCAEAALHSFASVCVNPIFVSLARNTLDAFSAHGTPVCAVVGFPLGASTSETKAFEAEAAIADGAAEIDIVLPIGMLKVAARRDDHGEAFAYVLRDIAAVVAVCRRSEQPVVCKVILETCLLSDEERDLGVLLSSLAGADFVKTSTGFSKGGATVTDVAAMVAAAQQSGEGGTR